MGAIRAQLHFILEIPGAFGGRVCNRSRIPDQVKLARNIMEKSQHGVIADASRGKLSGPKMVFVYPLHPSACAEGVLAFGEAQVIGQAVVFSAAKKRVVAGRGRNRRWGDSGCAASDDNLARITS